MIADILNSTFLFLPFSGLGHCYFLCDAKTTIGFDETMDGLSAAASIIAVIQITASIASALRDYFAGVRHARDEIQRLYHSINSLRDVVAAIQPLQERYEMSMLLAALLTTRDGPLQTILRELREIEKKLGPSPKEMLAKFLRSLKWPFNKAEVDKLVESVESTKATLALQFAIENLNSSFKHYDLSEHQRILQWLSLSLPDPSKEHNIARDKHQPTTGAWLLRSKELQTWMKSGNSLMWLKGWTGAGKTILCSTVIDHVQTVCKNELATVTSYWYFTFTDTEKQNLSNMLGSVIRDIFNNRRDTPEELQDAFEVANNGLQKPTTQALTEMLKAVGNGFENIYIIVDAIDECPKYDGERAKFLNLLQEIFSWNLCNLHLFVTSRPELDIAEAFEQMPGQLGRLQIIDAQGPHLQEDISKYLLQKFQEPVFSKWRSSLKEVVKYKLASRAQGMFRLVALQLDALSKCRTEASVLATIDSLPKSLDTFYERVFLEIQEEDQREAIIALQWLAYAARELSVAELAEAVTLQTDRLPYVDVSQRLLDGKLIIEMLTAGLITTWTTHIQNSGTRVTTTRDTGDDHQDSALLEKDMTKVNIRLAHFSIQEYLLSSRICNGAAALYRINELSANILISEMCLAYLIHIADLYQLEFQINDELYNLFPLLHYAVTSWAEHLRRLQGKPRSTRLDSLTLKLMRHSSPGWQFFLHFTTDERVSKDGTLDSLSAHITDFAIEHKTKKPEIRINGPQAINPLTWITRHPLIDQIRLCMDNGLGQEAYKGRGFLATPLYAAAEFRQISAAKIFLERGLSVNDSEGPRGTALHVAAHIGYLPFFRLCVESGSDLNIICEPLGTPLAIATINNHQDVISFLLRHGADPNIPDPTGNRLLNVVLRRKSPNYATIRKLLDNGADIDASGASHSTPLQEAAEIRKEPIVRFLLENGANPNSCGAPYGGPLEAAAWAGRTTIVRMLLEHGANVRRNGPSNDKKKYKTPLEHAVYQLRPRVVKLLLDSGALLKRDHEWEVLYTSLKNRILDLESQTQSPWLMDRLNRSKEILAMLDNWIPNS